MNDINEWTKENVKEMERKQRFEAWFANHVKEHMIRVTKSNPNAVAIGCFLHTKNAYEPDSERRYV
tara:strand:- start:1558 stop:1755 length:198 start_codon:yes stop_codon:yes gene_type:complete